MLKKLWALTFLFSLWALPAQAFDLLNEGWEGTCAEIAANWSDNYSKSPQTNQFPCETGSVFFGKPINFTPFSLDSTTKFAGSNSLRINFVGTQDDCNPKPCNGGGYADRVYPGGSSTEIWIREYVRFSSGFLTAGGGAFGGPGLLASGTKGLYNFMISARCIFNNQTQTPVPCGSPGSVQQENGWYVHWQWGSRQHYMAAQGLYDANPRYGSQNMLQNQAVKFNQPDNKWVCHEYHIRLNSPGVSDGLYEAWSTNMTDSGPTIKHSYYPNRQFLGPTPSDRMPSDARWFKLRMYRQDGLGSMWKDNILFSTTRVGCSGGVGSGGDSTPPAASTITGVSTTSTSATVTFTAPTDTTMGTHLMLRCAGLGCSSHAQVGTVNHVQGQTTYTFPNTGLTPGTVYSYRTRPQDTSGNLGALSNIMEGTTTASSALPTMTSFNATASGGTVTFSSSPATANVKFTFGSNSGGTPSSIERTIAQLPGGVLTFQWPANTDFACTQAGNAVPTYNTITTICDGVIPQPAAGAGLIRVLTSNPRWLTVDGIKAVFMTGRTKENACGSILCSLQDRINPTFTDLIEKQIGSTETFDGTSSDIGANWTPISGVPPMTKTSGVIQATNITGYGPNIELYNGAYDGNQFRCATIGTLNDATLGHVSILLRYSDTSKSGYEFRAQVGSDSGRDASIRKHTAPTTEAVLTEVDGVAWAPGDRVCGYAIGNSLRFYKNEAIISALTTTDSTYRHGLTGLLTSATGAASSATITSTRGGQFQGDINAELDAIVAAGHNFTNTYITEQHTWGSAATIAANTPSQIALADFPWALVGRRIDCSSGTCVQVGVYDLDTLNQAHFDRLRAFAMLANSKGVTPSIMLFNGWFLNEASLEHSGFSHPFYCPSAANCNNEQSLHADVNGDGMVEEAHSLVNGSVNGYQTAYINKVVDTLHDLGGFMYEVSLEDQGITTDWHNFVYDAIRAREASQGYQQHLVRFSTYGGTTLANNNAIFTNSRPEIVSPLCATTDGKSYISNSPANYLSPGKVVFADSDHCAGAMPSLWSWKVFLRGNYPLLLGIHETAPELAVHETQMAQTRVYAEKIDLATMHPENTSATDIFSTSYGLSSGTTTKCAEYLMLIPTDIAGTIDLSKYNCTAGTTFTVEYFNVTTGVTSSGGTINGGAVRSFNPAGSDPMVVYLKVFSTSDITPPVLSGGSPSSVLAAGATSVSMQFVTNENATCRYASTDIAYGSMAAMSSTGGTTHSVTISPLVNGNAYSYYTRCIDVAGNPNTSGYNIAWSVTASGGDVSPPILTAGAPSGILVSTTTGVSVTVTSNEAATCKIGTSAGVAYASMGTTMGTTGGTSHSHALTGLTPGTTVTRYLRCTDGSNPTLSDYVVTFQIAGLTDTTPPVLSAGLPVGIHASGTTSVNVGVTTSEAATCKIDTDPDIAYGSMAATFGTTGGLVHTTSVGSLVDGTSYTRYIKCQDVAGNPTVVDFIVTWSVSSGADTELPTAVSSLGGASILNDTAIKWTLGAATDNVAVSHYLLQISTTDDFTILAKSALIPAGGLLEYDQTGLQAGEQYYARAKAVDTNGNPSLLWLTSTPVFVALPETMIGLTATALYTNSAIVTVTGSEQVGVVGAFELCTGASCNSGWISAGIPAGLSVTLSSLSHNTTYGVRGKWVNLVLGGISAAFSDVLYFTTANLESSLSNQRGRRMVPGESSGSRVSGTRKAR